MWRSPIIKHKRKRIKVLRVATYEYADMEELRRYLKKLNKDMAEAAAKNDSVQAQALAHNIIHVMREIERDNFEKEAHVTRFKVRDIVLHALQGNLDFKEALEKLKKMVS